MGLRSGLVGLLGSDAVSRVALTATGRRLRVLAYHDVPSARAFAAQLEHLAERYQPVTAEQVAAAFNGGAGLPPRAVWITFDDGFPAVVEAAAPLLDRYGIMATMYVCPGVIDTTTPYWWEVVREAERRGLLGPVGAAARHLKTVPDAERRERVADLATRIESRGEGTLERHQLTTDQLRTWVSAGHDVGNHTWDHPLLDRCSDDEQRRQVDQAHGWLRDVGVEPVRTFAYPNGNWASPTERRLTELGYATAVGFDHRLVRPGASSLRLSRLRVDADAGPARVRAISSGLHSGLLGARERVTSLGREVADPRTLPR